MSEVASPIDAPTDAAGARGKHVWIWSLVLAALVLGVFSPGLGTGTFVNGPDAILRLPLLSNWRNIPTLFTREFMIFTEGQYRPLSYALVALVRTVVSADHTFFWHLWLVAFHVLNTLLVFALARSFARRTLAAFAAAAVFALHPMASLFANQMNPFHYVLAGSFYLGTLACWVRWRRRGRWPSYVAALALFLCGLLTSKMLLTLPVFLVLYELLYERAGVRRALTGVLPFAGLCLVLSPCWLLLRPHPIFYDYPGFPAGSGWFSLYTFVARTGLHLEGVAGGFGFERPIFELAERVMTPYHAGFVLWGIAIAAALVLSLWQMRRHHWWGLGVLLALVSVVPYVTTTFHCTRDFISWNYLYLVLAGFALAAGGLVDLALGLRQRPLRGAVTVLAVLLVASYGALLAAANVRSRSVESWWRHVLELNPKSQIASVELGKACLERGDYETALSYLFAPRVKSISESALIMSHYYCEENELLAATVQFHMAVDPGVTELHEVNRVEMVGAEIVYAAGALDYTEQALTLLLMTDRYDTAAMRMLGEVLSRKGYVSAARMYLEEAHRLDPADPETARALERLHARMYRPAPAPDEHITPPGPDWLRYLMSQRMSTPVSDAVIKLSYRLTRDPVIQLEAGKCLLGMGDTELAREKFNMAIRSMPEHPYVRACKQSADAESAVLAPGATGAETSADAAMWNDMGYLAFQQGRLEDAIACFRAALKVDPKSARAHNNLGLVLVVQEQFDLAIPHYRKAIAIDPTDPEPYRSLASALMAQRRFAECIDTLSTAVKAVPDDRDLPLRLAWVLAVAPDERLRDGERAVKLAEPVVRSGSVRTPRSLNILAAAYAEVGRFDEAVSTAREAAELARAQGDEGFVRTSEERLRLYERRRPYRPHPPPRSP